MAGAVSAIAASRVRALSCMVKIFTLGSRYVNSLRLLVLVQLGDEIRPELLDAKLVADAELDRLEVPAIRVVRDLLALLGAAVRARLVRLVPVPRQAPQIHRLAEAREEQFQQ